MRCEIQWVDHQGNPTPDTNVATCIAVSIQTRIGGGDPSILAFPCCAKHAKELDALVRNHIQKTPNGTSRWARIDLTFEEVG